MGTGVENYEKDDDDLDCAFVFFFFSWGLANLSTYGKPMTNAQTTNSQCLYLKLIFTLLTPEYYT